MRNRIVIDTNVYLSHLLRRRSIPSRVVERVWRDSTPLVSDETLFELEAVLRRSKFQKYFQPDQATVFLAQLSEVSESVTIRSQIQVCRRPKDDKFLELAVDGQADHILTGDQDLLALHPFRGISIVSPTAYLAED